MRGRAFYQQFAPIALPTESLRALYPLAPGISGKTGSRLLVVLAPTNAYPLSDEELYRMPMG
jgi:hypothetical protein